MIKFPLITCLKFWYITLLINNISIKFVYNKEEIILYFIIYWQESKSQAKMRFVIINYRNIMYIYLLILNN